MKKVLFIDRDGTLIREPEDEQIDSFEKLELLPGMVANLARIARELDYDLVMVTNQDGLGTDAFPENDFWPVQSFLISMLEGEGIRFSEVLIDRSFPDENLPTRKPGTGMLTHYIKGDYDLGNSYVIGDRLSDVKLAENLGSQAIFIGENESSAALSTWDWAEIYAFLAAQDRTAQVSRKTSETSIDISLNLDGTGKASIDTGIGFFDHMLEQLAKHGGLDLSISAQGDLHIDTHHTIEDTALTLGLAFDQALGSRKGIERYGFLLPMDDSLAQVAIDFGGRPWFEWDVTFTSETLGEMPTQMASHFFKSFCDTARCNLNMKAAGENDHHKMEALFKAWARSIGKAVNKTGKGDIPSTKGSL